jgi:MinD superfamily P-loop ATPase
MKSIVILSGKGGVGKSSITASLAVAISKENEIICADCDVDASNLSLLFSLNEEDYKEWKSLSTNQVAVIDKEKCIKCGKCLNICYFKALEQKDDFPEVSKFGCEGCGACELVCPVKAISLKNINNAKIGYAETSYHFNVVSAQLEAGFSGSGKVVSEVKKKARELTNSDYLIIDSAAGVGCPVIASVSGSDYAIIVTEPTPSGFSNLKKALKIVNHFNIKKGIIINKYDINNLLTQKISNFAKEEGIEILSKIPFDKSFVESMTKMIPIIDYKKDYECFFNDLRNKVLRNFK